MTISQLKSLHQASTGHHSDPRRMRGRFSIGYEVNEVIPDLLLPNYTNAILKGYTTPFRFLAIILHDRRERN